MCIKIEVHNAPTNTTQASERKVLLYYSRMTSPRLDLLFRHEAPMGLCSSWGQ